MNKVDELIKMTEEVDTILTLALNKMHGTNYSKRFWKILTGPYVTAIILNRKLLESTDIESDETLYGRLFCYIEKGNSGAGCRFRRNAPSSL